MGKQWTPPADMVEEVSNKSWMPPSDQVEEVKKKVSTPASQSTFGLSGNGLNPFQSSPQSTDLTPVLPQYRDEVRQQQDSANKRISDNLKAQQVALDPEHRAAFAKAASIVQLPDEMHSDKAAADHYNYMQTPIGKTLGALQYMGSKATKGTLQIAKGAAYLAELGGNPIAPITGVDNPGIDAAFDMADKNTNFGLTKGDQQRMEENPITANLGGLAEFLPAAAAASGTGGATFYLQGLGQGKDAIDHAEKSGAKINPLVKNAFILGTGTVNGLLMGELGGSMFKSLPAGLRGDITASITANAVKEASGKELTNEAFKSLLDKGAKDFTDNLQRGGINVLEGYKHAVTNLSALNGANFALKKGVDISSDKPVFNESLGDLASGLNDVATKQAPFFSIPAAIGAASKLTPYSNYKNTVVESLMHDSTPENIEQTKQDIADYGHNNGWRTEDIEASIGHVDKLAQITKSLPNNLPEKKIVDAVDLVHGRNNLQAELSKEQEGRKQLDPSMQEIVSPNEQMLIDKINQANDKLKDIATGGKTTYSKGIGEEDGKFFKTINGKKEEITPSRYELEATERPVKPDETVTEPSISPFKEEVGAVKIDKEPDYYPYPKKSIEDMTSDEIFQHAKEIKDYHKSLDTRFFGEDGAKEYQNAVAVENSSFASTEKRKEAYATTKKYHDSLTPEQSKIFFGENSNEFQFDPDELRDISRKVNFIEESESVEDLAGSIKNPLMDFRADSKNSEAKILLKAAARKAAELNIDPQIMLKKAIERIVDDLPGEKGMDLDRDKELLTKSILNELTKTATSAPEPTKEIQQGERHVPEGNEITSPATESAKELIKQPEHVQQPKEKTSSIKNAKIDEDRVTRGLSPLMGETAKDFPKVWNEAMERLNEDPDVSKDLVKELSEKPRSTTDVENALLSHRLVEVKNKYDKLTEDIIKAQDEGKDIKALTDKLDAVSDELHVIEQVSKDTGRETARGLNSRKLMLKDDFSLAAMETKKRVATGRKLTTEEREDIRKIHAEFGKKSSEYEAKISELEQRNRDLIERDALNRLKAEVKKEGRAKTRTNRQQNKQDLIQDIRAKLKQSRGTLSASPIPYLPELIKISPELAKLAKLYIEEGIDKLDELVDKIHEDLKEGFDGLTKREVRDALSGYGKDPQEQTKGEIQKKLDELRQQAKLQSKLEDLEAKEFKTPERKKKAVAHDIAELRKKIKDLQQPEISLKALKIRTENSIKEYERRLREKDFSTAPPRKPIELDPEAIKAKANLKRVKDEFELALERDRLNNRTTSEKVVDKILAWRRGILLSSVVTLGKIGTAATYRIIGTPLHEISGTLLRGLPLLKRIAAKAPREGHAFNLTAEQKAIASLWDADTWQQVKKKILGKHDDIDTVFGDKKTHVDGNHLLEIFGNLHGAEKELVKVNEFKRSVELRTKYYDENGVDIHNPLIQVQIGTEAYKDANRSIFMSDNVANNAYKTFTGYLESKSVKSKFGSAGRNAATIARVLLPIVKVPTNYLVEKTQYIPMVGALKAFNIMRKGIDGMTPEQSDYVMRVMKKQGLGYGLFAIGYLNPANIGGLYVPGEKRKEGDLKAGDLIVYGVHIPHWMTHTPMLTILQLGATFKRAVDAYDPKKENGGELIAKAGLATAGDVVESTPFYSTPKDVMKSLEGTEKAKEFIGNFLRSLVVPPDVKRLAEMNDKDGAGNEIKRKPETILQGIEMGIPGLRKNVPIKTPRPYFDKIKLGETEYKLSNDQLLEREKYYQEFNNSENGQRLQTLIKSAKTDRLKKKYTEKLHESSNKYSKSKILQKYRNEKTGGYDLKIN